ncbi:MAG: hypothetical protein ACYC1I_12215 [Acidimicrobiales bacterium]
MFAPSPISTTTTLSATTPTQPSGSTPPDAGIVGHLVKLGLNTVQVSWATPNAMQIAEVSLYTFKGSSCIIGVHSPSTAYVPSINASSGSYSSTGKKFPALRQ